MARTVQLEVIEGNLTKTLTGFCSDLLTTGKLEALLVPLELPDKTNVVPALVTDSTKLDSARFLAPLMPVNTARVISDMTKVTPSSKKIGVVLRNCEIRALIELVKLRQASLENIILIGIDCPGTYTVNNYTGRIAKGESPGETILQGFLKGEEDPDVRQSCAICSYPLAQNADLTIELMGHDIEKSIAITAATDSGEALLEGTELPEDTATEKRTKTCLLYTSDAADDWLVGVR